MAQYELHARGLVCPEPLMRVRNRVRELEAGDLLLVMATDPSTSRDLTNFCRFMGHILEQAEERDTPAGVEFVYRIRKGP